MADKLPRVIKQSEVKLGDIVNLGYPPEPAADRWLLAKVIRMTDTRFTVFRPWMSATEDGYPYVGVEVFDIFRSDTQTIRLVDRAKESE